MDIKKIESLLDEIIKNLEELAEIYEKRIKRLEDL